MILTKDLLEDYPHICGELRDLEQASVAVHVRTVRRSAGWQGRK